MDNSCEEIVRQKGVSWLMEKTVPREGVHILDALADRHVGIQDVHVYRSNGSSVVVIPNNIKYASLGTGVFSIGAFINLPSGSDTGDTHVIFDAPEALRLYEKSGNLYFRVWLSEGGYTEVNTEDFGINFCDSLTKYIKIYRNNAGEYGSIGLALFHTNSNEVELPSNVNLSFSGSFAVGGGDTGTGYSEYLEVNSYVSGVFILRALMTKEEDFDFWLHGIVHGGTHLFLKLDEAKGSKIADSTGLGIIGAIEGYTEDCWATHSYFLSWQNTYGYSTGAYVKESSPTLDIEDDMLVPAMFWSTEIDACGVSLEYKGRVGLDVTLEDIAAFSPNGITWGQVSNPANLQLRPGQDEFSVFFIFEYIEGMSGTLFVSGDRYKIEVLETSECKITIGGTEHTLSLEEGSYSGVIFVGLETSVIWINGTIEATIATGTAYSSGGYVSLLGDNGSDILNGGVVTFLGVKAGLLLSDEIEIWFENYELTGDYIVAYYLYSFTDVLFDVSGNREHVVLTDYEDTVWEGTQSEMAYIANGFTEVYNNRTNLINPVVIPFDKSGNQIRYNIYGSNQIEVICKDTGGLLIFDAYLNFNPGNKILGFWSRFWDKGGDTWKALNSNYFKSNHFKWNLQELVMDYLTQSLNPADYNFVFSGSRKSSFNFSVELNDLLVLNMGNNIKEKAIQL